MLFRSVSQSRYRGIDSSTFGTLQNDVDTLLAAARSVVDTPIEPAIPSTDSVTTVLNDA